MYSSSNPQFVFKQGSGKVWNFYYDEKLGLCYCNLTKRNSWSEPASLQKNIQQNFCIEMDLEDNFHIIYQDRQGNIFYSLLPNDNGSIKTFPVLNSKSVSSYNKYFFIIPLKDNIHLFYVLDHNNSYLLIHQVINGGKPENPKVVDYVCNASRPYSASLDKSGNIYVFYQSSDGRNYQIGYKKYLSLQKFWGEFTPITRSTSGNELPWTVIDSKNTIHICYQRHTDRAFEIIYQQKVPERNMWTDEILLHSSVYPFSEASIAYINEKLTVYWVRDDVIYSSSSGDYGITWSKPARYSFSVGRQLVCVRYKTGNTFEAERVISTYLPGSFINGLKLAFYSGAAENEMNNLSADELKNMIVDSLKLIRNSIEELKESDAAMKESISRIIISQQTMDREFVKHTLRVNMMENEMKQIRQTLGRLEEFKIMLQNLQTDKKPEVVDTQSQILDMIPETIGENSFKKYMVPHKSMAAELLEQKMPDEDTPAKSTHVDEISGDPDIKDFK